MSRRLGFPQVKQFDTPAALRDRLAELLTLLTRQASVKSAA